MLHLLLGLVLLAAPGTPQDSDTPELPPVLSLRDRARVRDEVLRERLDVLVPHLLRREGIDLWIVAGREVAEDPVLSTMLPSRWMSARRRTILVFHDPGDGAAVQRFAISRYGVEGLFRGLWDPEQEPDAWRALSREIQARDPARIAINVSRHLAHADGLTFSEHEALLAALPQEYRGRLVSGQGLAKGWLETRTPREADLYPTVCRLAHTILAEGLRRGVHPGVTTTEDLAWWYRERAAELDLEVWFHPIVTLQRPGPVNAGFGFAEEEASRVLRRGDLVHVDFGVRYLGLCTDTQHHGYILKIGEEEAPAALERGLALANRLQDIVTTHFAAGRTGNEVLAAARAQMEREALNGTIYCHPLGLHGHGAGAYVGLWDQQDGVPGTGDLELVASSVWAIELAVRAQVPEWDLQEVDFMVEEDAWFDGTRVTYLDSRQTELTLVR